MKKRYYSAGTLSQTLHAFEDAYGISTDNFMEAHRNGDETVIGSVPNRSRSQWAMFARSYERMSGDGLAAHVARGLQTV